MKSLLHAILIISLAAQSLFCEEIVELTNGTKFRGTILQKDDKHILFRFNYGTIGLDNDQIRSITNVPGPDPLPVTANRPDQLPAWSAIIVPLSKLGWAKDLAQIPATVIDVGVMRNVPYVSFRCSGDYEINIYGDLDSPVCIEAGIYRSLLSSNVAKQNCIDLLKNQVLQNPLDRTILSGLDLAGDVATHGKLTLEITPPTAADAYGGWWAAVYFADAVEAIRAKDSELAAITAPRTPTKQEPVIEDTTPAWSNDDLARARAANPSSGGSSPAPANTGGGPSSGSRVYVRGYTRKDGTYVRAHTRSR
jgi:hypothetical protein